MYKNSPIWYQKAQNSPQIRTKLKSKNILNLMLTSQKKNNVAPKDQKLP